MSNAANPCGDGFTCKRIANILTGRTHYDAACLRNTYRQKLRFPALLDDGMMRMRIVRLTFPSWHRRYAEKDALRDSWVYVRQYCAKIDEAARNRMELIVPELVKRNGEIGRAHV